MARGESMRFIECHSFKLLCTALLLLSLLTINIALVTIVVIVSATVIESTCIRIGPRFNANCCNIVTRDGRELAWTNVVRYLGIFTESASCFKCFLDNAKRSFYWSFNGTFGRVGRIASKEVIVQLVKAKCFPCSPVLRTGGLFFAQISI